MKNIKFISLTLLLLSIIPATKAQETFLKIYPSSDCREIYSVIESDDNNLIFCGVINTNPEHTTSVGTMMKIAMNGEIVDSTNYAFENGNSYFSELVNPTNTNSSYFLSGSIDSIGSDKSYNSVFIHSIDNDMNIVEQRNFGMWPDTVNTPWDFEILDDTTAYILSFFKTPNSSLSYNYSIIKAHLTNGEYDYFVADDSTNKAITSLIIDKVSELIKINYMVFHLPWVPYNPIAKISYDLSNIEIVMPDNEFHSQTKLAKINDSSYFLSGQFYEEYIRNLGLSKYNLNDSLLYTITLPGETGSITYPGMGKKNILATTDYIWVMGWYYVGDYFPPCAHTSFIVLNKLNYNLELIEQIFYGQDDAYLPKDIIETSDNHIVVVGDYYDIQSYDCISHPFVLKVNSEGLIVNTDNNNMPQAMEAIIIPNPGKDFLQVKLGVQHNTATLQLFDLNGRLVLTEVVVTDMQHIDTSELTKGFYPYRISTSNKVIGMGKWIKE